MDYQKYDENVVEHAAELVGHAICSLSFKTQDDFSFRGLLTSLYSIFDAVDLNSLPWRAIMHQLKLNLQSVNIDLSNPPSDDSMTKEEQLNVLSIMKSVFQEYCFISTPISSSPTVKTDNTHFAMAKATLVTNDDDDDDNNNNIDVAAEVPRQLNNFPCLAYLKRNVHERVHMATDNLIQWGQRKLLIMEIEFLTRFAAPGDTVLYVGASPGSHIPFLASTLFPELKFVLYDPAEFGFDVNDDSNVTLVNDFFRDEDMQSFFPLRSSLLFISDVRRIQHNELLVAEDMLRQQRWHLSMRPKASLMKFRLPYGPGKVKGEEVCMYTWRLRGKDIYLFLIAYFCVN